MKDDFIKKARLHFKCKSEGINDIKKCYFPDCACIYITQVFL